MAKPLIYIVGTGGTIASRYVATGAANVGAASAADLAASVPGLADIAEVRVIEHSNVTSDIIDTPTIVALGKVVRRLLADDNTAGVVITHGTATLEESAYFLDLTL